MCQLIRLKNSPNKALVVALLVAVDELTVNKYQIVVNIILCYIVVANSNI